MNKYFEILYRFVLLVLFQSLVLNNIQLFGVATPYIYPLIILLLPMETPTALLLILGAISGLSVDAFSQTGGIHGFATVFVAFARPFILRVITPKEGYQVDDQPTMASLGITWFLIYISLCLLLHHIVYYSFEVMSFQYIQFLSIRIFSSLIVSIVLILVIQFLFYPKKSVRSSING